MGAPSRSTPGSPSATALALLAHTTATTRTTHALATQETARPHHDAERHTTG